MKVEKIMNMFKFSKENNCKLNKKNPDFHRDFFIVFQHLNQRRVKHCIWVVAL